MAEFKSGVLTTLGTNLLAKAQSGSCKLEFTRFATGNGTYTGDESVAVLQAMTALGAEKESFGITKAEYLNDATTQLTLIATNKNNTAGYYITEIGVFATDPDLGEILYAVYVAQTDKADWFSAYNGTTPSSIMYTCALTVANASEVTVKTNMDALATEDDISALDVRMTALEGTKSDTEDGFTVFANMLATLLKTSFDPTQHAMIIGGITYADGVVTLPSTITATYDAATESLTLS